MTYLVPVEDIERIVGARRAETAHIGRLISASRWTYILHSRECKESGIDLRDCQFSVALDNGVEFEDWCGFEDEPVYLEINPDGLLIPDSLMGEVCDTK